METGVRWDPTRRQDPPPFGAGTGSQGGVGEGTPSCAASAAAAQAARAAVRHSTSSHAAWDGAQRSEQGAERILVRSPGEGALACYPVSKGWGGDALSRAFLCSAGADSSIIARMASVQLRSCSAAVLPSCQAERTIRDLLHTHLTGARTLAAGFDTGRTKSLGAVSTPASSSMPTQASFPLVAAHISAVFSFCNRAGRRLVR